MEKHTHQYSLEELSAYLRCELSVSAMQAIDVQLENDPVLAAQLKALLREQKLQQQQLFKKEVAALTLKIQSAASPEPSTPNPDRFRWAKKTFIGLLLAVSGSVLVYLSKDTLFRETLVMKFFHNQQRHQIISLTTPYLVKEKLRNVNFNPSNLLHRTALTAYEQENYKVALENFSKLVYEKKVNQTELKFYIAICQLKLEQPQKAVQVLQTIDNQQDTYILYSVYWHLGLSYLVEPTQQQILLAEQYLKQIPINHEYGADAAILLEQLKQIVSEK